MADPLETPDPFVQAAQARAAARAKTFAPKPEVIRGSGWGGPEPKVRVIPLEDIPKKELHLPLS